MQNKEGGRFSAITDIVQTLGALRDEMEPGPPINDPNTLDEAGHIERYRPDRIALIHEALPSPTTLRGFHTVLVWLLALKMHRNEIAPDPLFIDFDQFEIDVEGTFNSRFSQTIKETASGWHKAVVDFLDEHLWSTTVAPDQLALDALVHNVWGEWYENIMLAPSSFSVLESFNVEMAILQSKSIPRIGRQ